MAWYTRRVLVISMRISPTTEAYFACPFPGYSGSVLGLPVLRLLDYLIFMTSYKVDGSLPQ